MKNPANPRSLHSARLNSIKDKLPRHLRTALGFARLRTSALFQSIDDQLHSDGAVPPPLLRLRVGATSRKSFLSVGKRCAEEIVAACPRPIQSYDNILDFGCGCGRVLRWIPSRRITGVDIDEELIAYCRKQYTGDFQRTGYQPPLPFSKPFDLIYGISVFTHLDEALQFAWLAELKRISTGTVILTTLEDASYLSDVERETLRTNGLLFRITATGRLKPDGLPDFYQTTFHTREYVEREWSRFFRITKYIPRGINDHQTLVVMESK